MLRITSRLALPLWLASLGTVFGAPQAIAEASPEARATPSLRALRLEQPVVVDGQLDDWAWTQAEQGGGFVQRQPEELEPSTEQTSVQVAYTPDTLYIAIHARDSEPGKVIGREMGRDAQLFRDDGLVVLLDTFHDRRNAYFLETNPNSSRTDGYVTDEGRDFSTEWDGIWDVRCRRTHDGWTAEYAIPFRSLRFDPNSTTWGLQVRRIIKRKSEITFWSPIGRDANVFRMSKAGTLTGLEGLRTGRNLRVKPYVSLASLDEEASPEGSVENEEIGLDVKWGVTQGLSLDVTVNTDFAETEVDEQQVNLSRFSLFFPEKREFFLENAGIFEFGPSLGSALKVFFSRRIGLAEGRPVALELGARLAGREGPWSIGLLGVRTGSAAADPERDLEAAPETDWGTLRLKRNFGERSNLGLIVTHRDDGAGGSNRVYGLDGEWKPTDNIDLWAFGTLSEGPTEDSDGWAGGVGGSFDGSFWSGDAHIFEIEDTFDPQLGFVLRRGRRNYKGEVDYQPRPDWKGVRNLRFELKTDIFTRDDETETRVISADLFGMDFLSGESFVIWTTDLRERLFEPFEIFDGVVLETGDYRWNEIGLWVGTNGGRPLAVEGWVETGKFFDGDRLAHNVTVTWRPSRYFRSRTTWARNDIDLPAGAFETNLWRQRFSVSFHTDMTVEALVQYSDAAEQVGANLRFNWHYRPGSDLFVVYNHGWDAPSFSDLADRDRQVIVKLTYSWDA